jgi:hypothetical protein
MSEETKRPTAKAHRSSTATASTITIGKLWKSLTIAQTWVVVGVFFGLLIGFVGLLGSAFTLGFKANYTMVKERAKVEAQEAALAQSQAELKFARLKTEFLDKYVAYVASKDRTVGERLFEQGRGIDPEQDLVNLILELSRQSTQDTYLNGVRVTDISSDPLDRQRLVVKFRDDTTYTLPPEITEAVRKR